MRSFATLACLHQEIRSPRAWLFRIASNLWLNRVRDMREVATGTAESPEAGVPTPDPRAVREAAGSLIAQLAPQERAAIVLKDVFEMSLEETAEALSTTTGAVKAALHRGRGKLAEPQTADVGDFPRPAVLDAFCAAFNARDLDGVTSLLLENVVVEFPGLAVEYGAETARNGSLTGVLFGDPSSDRGGIAPGFRAGVLPKAPRLEARAHRGEHLLLAWFEHQDGEAVRAVSRVSLTGDRIASLRTYLHAPDVLAELCAEMGVHFRSSGYRYWW